MRNVKRKSLGTLVYPTAEVTDFSGVKGEATITLTAGGKCIKVNLSVWCARKLADLSREIVAKQRAYAMSEWTTYKSLRDYTGYKAPDGQE